MMVDSPPGAHQGERQHGMEIVTETRTMIPCRTSKSEFGGNSDNEDSDDEIEDEDNEDASLPDLGPRVSSAEPRLDPVETGRKIYRPKLPSQYIEPDLGPDMLDGMELLFAQFGKSLTQAGGTLGPRDDIIEFDINQGPSGDRSKHPMGKLSQRNIDQQY